MKLAILSCSRKCYSTRRLREAAAQRGHKVKVLNTLKFAIDLAQGEPDLYFRQKQLSRYDAVLPRIGASITYFGTAVVRQFAQNGCVLREFVHRYCELARQASQPANPQSTPYRHPPNDVCP